jgi:hypothetical protein
MRVQRRVEASIPIQVRWLDLEGRQHEETTTAVEVSRRGLSFMTKQDLPLFGAITVVIPGRGPVRPEEGATDFFTEATVVRTSKEADEIFRVAVRFQGATLPMYSSEGV